MLILANIFYVVFPEHLWSLDGELTYVVQYLPRGKLLSDIKITLFILKSM